MWNRSFVDLYCFFSPTLCQRQRICLTSPSSIYPTYSVSSTPVNTNFEKSASEERPYSYKMSAEERNYTKSFERASSPITVMPQEKTLQKVMITHPAQLPREFSVSDEHNPRRWSVKRKCIIALFALLSAFVAYVLAEWNKKVVIE